MNQGDLTSHAARAQSLSKSHCLLRRGACLFQLPGVGVSRGQASHAQRIVAYLRAVQPFRAAFLQDRNRGPGMPQQNPRRSDLGP